MTDLAIQDSELRELLVDELDLVSTALFDAACQASRRLKISALRALTERARIPLAFVLAQLAQKWGVGFTDLRVTNIEANALRLIKEDFARAHVLVGFAVAGGRLSVAMADPRDRKTIADLQRLTGKQIEPHLAQAAVIHRAHLLYRGDLRELLNQTAGEAAQPATKTNEEASAADLLTRILEYAVASGASDIHIEPYEMEGLVRYRIDGTLQEVLGIPSKLLPSLTARVKVLSGMRIDERRAAQDGRCEAAVGGLSIDLRVSSVPTYWGEKVVLRVISKETVALDLEDLGLTAADYPIVLRNLLRPFGMILITGPTGSGKTTSLYAMITRLGAERQNVVNISTIEDPVEHPIPRVNQITVNAAAGVDFASGLRSLLRQDPDIIMVGEIRDRETADIAVRSALVGRLLLSTLHTNDATSAVPRLIDMGIEPFLLASTLQLVVAQRLVRRICPGCRVSLSRDAPAYEALAYAPAFTAAVARLRARHVLPESGDPISSIRLFHGGGCAQCNGTGYRGRVGLFELFEMDDRCRQMIMRREDASSIRGAAVAAGMKTMFEDAVAKTLLGETTADEILRGTV